MENIKSFLTTYVSNVDDHIDLLKHKLKQRLGWQKPLQIIPYRSYGNSETIYIKGRVLEDKRIGMPENDDSFWDNIVSMYKRLESDEVPGVAVKVLFDGNEYHTVTDGEGYFEVNLNASKTTLNQAWHNIHFETIDVFNKSELVKATGQVLIPPAGSLFGIISDIDDTVLISDATHLLKAARLIFLHNARTRLPFKGIAAFYRALQSGPDNSLFNPLFFVSSSPWNLYDLLIDFFSFNSIPKAPVLLRDVGTTKDHLFQSSHSTHKTTEIRKILNTYPELSFILIGDSGQQDPEIYLEMIKEFPGRILVAYIRDVSSDDRDIVVHKISQEATEAGVEMILVKDTEAAALHAARKGYIDSEALPGIVADKMLDIQEPTEIEVLIEGSDKI